MARTYSTYEAKAKFSEVLRRVREGERILIAYRGEPIAEIRPIEKPKESFEGRLRRLEKEGVIDRPKCKPAGPMRPLARRPGALARFLAERD